MKKRSKKWLAMKNALLIVFGVYSLALFCITTFNPDYAKDGILLDSLIDGVVSLTN